jgi:hypothetical protein
MGPLPQIYPITPHRIPDNIGMIQYKRVRLSSLIISLVRIKICPEGVFPFSPGGWNVLRIVPETRY